MLEPLVDASQEQHVEPLEGYQDDVNRRRPFGRFGTVMKKEWNVKSRDGRCLQTFVKNGLVDNGMTAAQVAKKYPQFAKYRRGALNEALQQARSNVRCGAVPDRKGRCHDHHDRDPSEKQKRSQSVNHPQQDPSFRNKSFKPHVMICPYVIDEWRDDIGRSRISVQVHLPSGNWVKEKITCRVSKNGKLLVLTLPMAPALEQPAKGILPFLQVKCPETKEVTILDELHGHAKLLGRMLAIAKLANRHSGGGFGSHWLSHVLYEQRIVLPHKCHELCVTPEMDAYFHGKDVVFHRSDGSTHLYVELMERRHGRRFLGKK
jgi:hypothetical protein